ncbi:hypothetical protein LEP1GSC132_1210 [Leptospira kirschneri str. 200803703]|nr:hypothetical protein LEP1GSC132_1210 [Leptospira kirschneri str. 200803703]
MVELRILLILIKLKVSSEVEIRANPASPDRAFSSDQQIESSLENKNFS